MHDLCANELITLQYLHCLLSLVFILSSEAFYCEEMEQIRMHSLD